jgi:hypothetical protein
MVPAVLGTGNGEQSRDRTALEDVERVVGERPLDVLGAAEMGFDGPADAGQPQDLGVRQLLDASVVGFDRRLLGPTSRHGTGGDRLGRDLPVDDPAVLHLVVVRVRQSGDQSLAQPEAGIDGGDLAVGGDRVGGEHDARDLREHHSLDDHSELHTAMVDALLQAIGDRAFGEQRGPALADMLQHRVLSGDVHIGVLLSREGRRRQVLGGRARAHGIGA